MQSRTPKPPGSLDKAQAEQAALTLLSRRAVSSGLLIDRLIRRGATSSDARQIADHLLEIGALDDRAYAEMLLRSVCRGKPAGVSFLRQRLRRDKLDAEVIEAAVAAHVHEHDLEQEALAWAQRQADRLTDVDPAKARRRLFGQLARRGFNSDTCKRAIEAAFGEDAR